MHTRSTPVHRVGGKKTAVIAPAARTPPSGPARPCYSRASGARRALSRTARPLPLPTRSCLHAPVTEADLAQSWRRIRAELRTAVTDATWQLYLDGLDALRLDGSTLVVRAPDESRAWVSERFSRLLQAAAHRVLGSQVAVRLVGPDEPAEAD